MESGQEVLFTDTVGFIRKLPHHLIDAFRSTLEEAKYADMILHVVDVSNPQMEEQMYIVYETLRNLGVKEQPILTAFNKVDNLTEPVTVRDFQADATVSISALTGEGLEELEAKIEQILREQKALIQHVFAYREAAKIQMIRKYGELLSEEYLEEGIAVKAYVPVTLYEKLLSD
jgi:GTP-binding protein HflX